MKTKPIIFSGPMITALLEVRKTQTRRVLKPQPGAENFLKFSTLHDSKAIFRNDAHGIRQDVPVPYAPGDLLWVREAWRTPEKLDVFSPKQIEARCKELGYLGPWCPRVTVADNLVHQWSEEDGFGDDEPSGRLRAAMHMPRWASRITLEVTNVRIQRIQDITEEDAIAEGMTEGISYPRYLKSLNGPRCAFMALWNSIHGPDAWQRNDWIAAYTFTVHHRNVDDLLADREVAA